jgi:hypothetical protein
MYDQFPIAGIKPDGLDNVPKTVSTESISRKQHDLILSADLDVPLEKHQINHRGS